MWPWFLTDRLTLKSCFLSTSYPCLQPQRTYSPFLVPAQLLICVLQFLSTKPETLVSLIQVFPLSICLLRSEVALGRYQEPFKVVLCTLLSLYLFYFPCWTPFFNPTFQNSSLTSPITSWSLWLSSLKLHSLSGQTPIKSFNDSVAQICKQTLQDLGPAYLHASLLTTSLHLNFWKFPLLHSVSCLWPFVYTLTSNLFKHPILWRHWQTLWWVLGTQWEQTQTWSPSSWSLQSTGQVRH